LDVANIQLFSDRKRILHKKSYFTRLVEFERNEINATNNCISKLMCKFAAE
jgi:hypothetical protein